MAEHEGTDAAPGEHVAGLIGNPLLDCYQRWRRGDAGEDPATWQARFSFAIPTDDALDLLIAQSPGGIVEIGAGTGYWARLLTDRGADVVAYDVAPPPSVENHWFAGQRPWFPVTRGDERAVQRHADRTLLLVWPTRNETWAADAAMAHLASGGQRLAYVGEPPGGRTGDLRLHAALGLVERCIGCAYGVGNVPCTCDVAPGWRRRQSVALPRWGDRDDALVLFAPARPIPARAWQRRLRIRR